jgi:hypothetical protein
MKAILIVNLVSALFTVVFAVYTGLHILHRYSVQHRVDKIKAKIMPMIVVKVPREQIIASMKKDGFSEHEVGELYEKFNAEYARSKSLPPQV